MRGNESTTAFSHALSALDFGAVLGLVASYCVGDAARRAVRSLQPGDDEHAIVESLAEIEEYRRRRETDGDIPIGDTTCRDDVEHELSRHEGIAPDRLLALAAAERAALEARSLLAGSEEFPRLAAIAAAITPHAELVAAVEKAIDSDGSIKDTASAELRTIRRDMRALRASLRTLSEKIVERYGADALGTVLGSRYVVLVPRGKIRKNTGLVHSTSHTGGSLYFEPFDLVERNNDLEARAADEKAEEARILAELCARVREAADEILANLDAVDRLDVVRAKARFCEVFRCTTPEVSARGRLRLVDARHPVLERLLSSGGEGLVPLGLTLEPNRRVMVITGPNAGGKTVALKTVGVATMLFQCGLQAPCGAGTELPVFARVFVDIGDEQSLEASLSTFTSHLKNLDTMSRHADADTLCLIDEIGDGTDPDEGAALAVATLEKLLVSGPAVIATTHYGRIKTFALQAEGVTNASMAFEEDEGRPLYRLLQGVAGTSRGLETARRTGFDAGVVERAQSYVGAEAFQLESLLGELERNLRSLEDERAEAARRTSELESAIADYHAKSAEYDLTRREAMRKASREAEALLRKTRREVEALVRSIRESNAERAAIRAGKKRIEELVEETSAVQKEAADRPRLESVRPGDRVSLSPRGSPAGVVRDVVGGSATVEFGNKRITIRIESLYEAAPAPDRQAAGVGYDFRAEPLESTSIDVRGHDREEAIEAVTRFLDRAVYTGVREVKIIHGIGTGVLSRAIRELLDNDDRVEATRHGEQAEGGLGVTIVQLTG